MRRIQGLQISAKAANPAKLLQSCKTVTPGTIPQWLKFRLKIPGSGILIQISTKIGLLLV